MWPDTDVWGTGRAVRQVRLVVAEYLMRLRLGKLEVGSWEVVGLRSGDGVSRIRISRGDEAHSMLDFSSLALVEFRSIGVWEHYSRALTWASHEQAAIHVYIGIV